MISKSDLVFRDSPCETKAELQEWLKYFLEIDFPDCIVDKEYSNCSPFDMVWDVYDSALRTQKIKNALYIGNRGGSKTLGAATIEFLLLQHDRRSVTHIGAIEKQAKRAYQYFQQFYRRESFKDFVDQMVMEKTVVKDRGSFEILPCTLAAVNGPHTPLVVRDEIDTVIDKQAYNDIKGIPVPMPDGRDPIEIGISTRKSAFGLVQQEVSKAEKMGLSVFQWGILEMTKRCPDSRSGLTKIPLYVNINTLEVMNETEWKRSSSQTKMMFNYYQGYEGCLANCKLFPACRGFLKHQTSTAKYLWSVDFTQQKVTGVSSEWATAQHLCIKPSPTGLVYTNYNPQKNVKSYKQMLEIWLLGKQIEAKVVTLEDFATIVEAYGAVAIMGVDFGFTHPAVALLIYIDKMDNVYVVKEFAVTGMDGGEFAKYLKDNWKDKFRIGTVYADVEDPGRIKQLKTIGEFTCATAEKDADGPPGSRKILNKDVKGGIETVRRFIKVPGFTYTKLYIHESCELLLDQIQKYHYQTDKFGNVLSDMPEKEHDDAPDALRYPLHSVYGGKIGEVLLDVEERQRDDEVHKAPTPAELATKLGIPFNDNSEEYVEREEELKRKKEVKSHLGIELPVDDEDEGDDKDDGFSFVF